MNSTNERKFKRVHSARLLSLVFWCRRAGACCHRTEAQRSVAAWCGARSSSSRQRHARCAARSWTQPPLTESEVPLSAPWWRTRCRSRRTTSTTRHALRNSTARSTGTTRRARRPEAQRTAWAGARATFTTATGTGRRSRPASRRTTAITCVKINQCVGCAVERRGTGIATLSSRRRVDGVEDDAAIQHERAVKF